MPRVGQVLRAGRRKVCVRSVTRRIVGEQDIIEVFTHAASRKRARRAMRTTNVVTMPSADGLVVAEFLRFHVLVRVYDGDPDAWLAQLRDRGEDGAEMRFAHWIRTRLRQDPELLFAIRRMVDATPFWRAHA
jgi:hypothetical protein